MTLFVVLPAYNESQNIASLLQKFLALKTLLNCGIVLVDDGSTDNTSQIAESFKDRLDILIEKHSQNLGLGAALRTGLKKAVSLAKQDDLVAVMDADDTNSPDLLPAMIWKIHEGFDVVIASRYAQGGKEVGTSFHRKLLSRICSAMLKLIFPIKNVKDYTCCYRVYRPEMLKKLAEKTRGNFFKEDGFVCMSELLINLSRCGTKAAEVPLVLRYDLKKGESKIRIFRTIWGYFRLIFR